MCMYTLVLALNTGRNENTAKSSVIIQICVLPWK